MTVQLGTCLRAEDTTNGNSKPAHRWLIMLQQAVEYQRGTPVAIECLRFCKNSKKTNMELDNSTDASKKDNSSYLDVLLHNITLAA
jgi:hypothetical protein